jgi:hypothetical protein
MHQQRYKEITMCGVVPRAFPKQKPARVACQATVEDYENGTHYNIARPFTVPKIKLCSRAAKFKLGTLCLCALHTKLAQDGLVEDNGTVATRSVRADVRRYPKKFVGGIYSWARDLTPEEIK